MNQKSHIELLNNLLPEMGRTGKPEQVMLKAARDRNMPPAQFEKLAQVYNAMKVNYTLDHQANRGDSFPIVNVPALLSEYMAYNPTGHEKTASITEYKVTDRLPSMFDVISHGGNQNNNLIVTNDNIYNEEQIKSNSETFDVKFNKAASSAQEEELSEFDRMQLQKKADILRTSILTGIDDELKKHASKIHHEIADAYNPAKRDEIAEDAFIAFGKEASAEIYSYLRDYCKSQHLVLSAPPDFTKKATIRTLARDRYGVLSHMKEIHTLLQLQKKASYDSEKKTSSDFNTNAKNLISALNPTSNVASVVKHVDPDAGGIMSVVQKILPDGFSEQKVIDDATEEAKYNSAAADMLMDSPIIAKADPAKVSQLVDEIKAVAPTMAKYPKMLAPIIAQAIQYDYNFPPQLVLNMATIEEKLSATNARKDLSNKEKYKK